MIPFEKLDPHMLAVVAVVAMFLGFLLKVTSMFLSSVRDFVDTVKAMHNANQVIQQDTIEAIREATAVLAAFKVKKGEL